MTGQEKSDLLIQVTA